MESTIIIETKVVGKARKLYPEWSIPAPPNAANNSGRTTLRELITWTISEEVEAFRQRQEERRLERVLTREQIDAGSQRGKIDMGGHDLHQQVDTAVAIETALQAFEDGIYFVFIDGQQY